MKKARLSLLLLFCFTTKAFSQPSNDAGLWASIGLEKKLTKKFSFLLTEEYRRKENFTRLNLLYTDIGFCYRPFDIFKVSLVYRNIDKFQLDKTFSFRHRIMLDMTVKKKFNRFALSFRERLQSEVRDLQSSEHGKVPEWYSRNKFELKYDIKKPITPWVAFEFRYQIHNPRMLEADKGWHRNRYFIGLDYKRNDKHSFGLYYMVQQEYDVSAPQNLYVIGIEYKFDF
jgi:hypothetical protein